MRHTTSFSESLSPVILHAKLTCKKSIIYVRFVFCYIGFSSSISKRLSFKGGDRRVESTISCLPFTASVFIELRGPCFWNSSTIRRYTSLAHLTMMVDNGTVFRLYHHEAEVSWTHCPRGKSISDSIAVVTVEYVPWNAWGFSVFPHSH